MPKLLDFLFQFPRDSQILGTLLFIVRHVMIYHKTLDVFSDSPIVSVKLGDSLNKSNIKEGDDVYFECR